MHIIFPNFAGSPKKSYFVDSLHNQSVILSIIIVSYNVKYFLEQCLFSARKAIATTKELLHQTEIIVIDNNSVDGSVEYLAQRFAEVKFIRNDKNIGFAKANNIALLQAKGKYILFLNPDTIIAEDSLSSCISVLESQTKIGSAGVRMIDGRGIFLKESKRGFPFPWAAFCRLSGLSALFPKSKLFASYYLGNLDEHKNAPVEVLSGAFMMIKKEVIDKTGGFDEQFFMYAEDIDLSYRMEHLGYLSYYVADTTIIHFKGESTKKDIAYVKQFYKAMDQFMRKHISSSGMYFYVLKTGVWVRSQLAAAKNNPIKNEKKVTRAFLMGGEENTIRIGNLLAAKGKTIVTDKKEANEIIFCEGCYFSFKSIIQMMQEKKRVVSYKIHSAGSSSIVGSDSKDGMGESIPL